MPCPIILTASWLQPKASVDPDRSARTHVYAGTTATACLLAHLDSSIAEADRFCRTNILTDAAKRARLFIDVRYRNGIPAWRRRRSSWQLCHLIAHTCLEVSPHALALTASCSAAASTSAASRRSRSVTSRHYQPSVFVDASSAAIRFLIPSRAPSSCSAWARSACISCSPEGVA